MEPPFPTDVQEFDSDDRISFSRLDNKFLAVHDDGSEFEFDPEAKRWIPADDGPAEAGQLETTGAAAGADGGDGQSSRKRGPEQANGTEVSLNAQRFSLDALSSR